PTSRRHARSALWAIRIRNCTVSPTANVVSDASTVTLISSSVQSPGSTGGLLLATGGCPVAGEDGLPGLAGGGVVAPGRAAAGSSPPDVATWPAWAVRNSTSSTPARTGARRRQWTAGGRGPTVGRMAFHRIRVPPLAGARPVHLRERPRPAGPARV